MKGVFVVFDFEIDDFMTHCEYKNLSPKTIASYEQTLRLFATYLKEKERIEQAKQVKSEHITNYVADLQTRGKYAVAMEKWERARNHPNHRRDYKDSISPCTINNYLRNLRVFFGYMVEDRRAKSNPVSVKHFVKAPRKAQEYLTDQEFARLLRCMDDSQFSEFRDSVIVQFLLDTGMRIGECLASDVVNIDMNRRGLLLPAEITKGKADRFVFFGTDMARLLRRWFQYKDRYTGNEYLFCTKQGTRLGVSTFESNLRKYARRAGIENVHPHVFRNNFSKRFLLAGGDIYTLSRLLGHSSVTVTEQAYLDLTSNDLREKYQNYSPLSQMKR